MCGFVGIWGHENGPVRLNKMAELIEHRGPDQTGTFGQPTTLGPYQLVTKRLSIQDLTDAGNQPMINDIYVLAFNGEIYNHWDLRKQLAPSTRWKSSSDTETILMAFSQWGIDKTLSRLNGIYSIALWHRQENWLLLARDPMGVKPLYYTYNSARIAFASELKALRGLSMGRVTNKALIFYLMFGYVPSPWSMVDGVHKVSPGEFLIFRHNISSPQRHRIRPKVWADEKTLPNSYEERVALVRDTLHNAVSGQMLSDAPVGLFLSGGIDSTVIASLMAKHGGYHSFSLRYKGATSANNDAVLAERLSKTLRWQHTAVELDSEKFEIQWPNYIASLDEPIAEANFIGQILLSEAARQTGIKVVLTGDGADELFHGYASYFAVERGHVLNRLPFFGPAAYLMSRMPFLNKPFKENLGGASSVWRKPMSDRFWITGAVVFDISAIASWLGFSSQQLVSWVQEMVIDTLKDNQWPTERGKEPSDVEYLARLELSSHVANHYNLRLDKTTMSRSVEARVPFQDLNVVNLGLRLPESDKMRNRVGKAILRDAFKENLPTYITDRRKQTFQAPLLSWINGPLASLRQSIAQHNGSKPWPMRETVVNTSREAYQIWSLMILDSWLDHYEISL